MVNLGGTAVRQPDPACRAVDIDNNGAVTLTGSTTAATPPASAAAGSTTTLAAPVTPSGSTISDNTVGADRGGIDHKYGTVTLEDSTVTGSQPGNCAPAGSVANCTS
jgi:hypothetical protein